MWFVNERVVSIIMPSRRISSLRLTTKVEGVEVERSIGRGGTLEIPSGFALLLTLKK
jgi:hypothetical protein